MDRLEDIVRFYVLLDRLKRSLGGSQTLANIGSYRDWPKRGIYLFFEPGEVRSDSGKGPRVV